MEMDKQWKILDRDFPWLANYNGIGIGVSTQAFYVH